MAQDFNLEKRPSGSEKNEPKVVGDVLKEYFASNEPLAVAYRERTTESEKQGWHSNTDLGCDVKTILRSDKRMKTGKEYQGVLRLDSEGIIDEFLCRDPHYTFIEIESQRTAKRNLHLFVGEYVTITRRNEGSLRPNFKPMPKIDKNFSVEKYASGVANELLWALEGLIENGTVEEESK
jgi:hypothetical protein